MKKLYVLLLAVIVIATSCREKHYGAFVVSGKVEHPPSDKIFLAELPRSLGIKTVMPNSRSHRGQAGRRGLILLLTAC